MSYKKLSNGTFPFWQSLCEFIGKIIILNVPSHTATYLLEYSKVKHLWLQ